VLTKTSTQPPFHTNQSTIRNYRVNLSSKIQRFFPLFFLHIIIHKDINSTMIFSVERVSSSEGISHLPLELRGFPPLPVVRQPHGHSKGRWPPPKLGQKLGCPIEGVPWQYPIINTMPWQTRNGEFHRTSKSTKHSIGYLAAL